MTPETQTAARTLATAVPTATEESTGTPQTPTAGGTPATEGMLEVVGRQQQKRC